MTIAEIQRQKDSELIHSLYEKYYGNSKKKEDLTVKVIKSKQAAVQKREGLKNER